MSFDDPLPMPTEPVWHLHRAVPCSCASPSDADAERGLRAGLVRDEGFSCPDGLTPREWMLAGAPLELGAGLLVCGFCDGDGWVWDVREEVPDHEAELRRLRAEIDRLLLEAVPLAEGEVLIRREGLVWRGPLAELGGDDRDRRVAEAEGRRSGWFAQHSLSDPVPWLEVVGVRCPICGLGAAHDEGGWWCEPCGVEWADVGEAGERRGDDG